MLVVDSSVWIDYFADRPVAACDELDRLLQDGRTRLVVPDLVLYEVLRGFRHERAMRQARLLLLTLSVESCGGEDVALQPPSTTATCARAASRCAAAST